MTDHGRKLLCRILFLTVCLFPTVSMLWSVFGPTLRRTIVLIANGGEIGHSPTSGDGVETENADNESKQKSQEDMAGLDAKSEHLDRGQVIEAQRKDLQRIYLRWLAGSEAETNRSVPASIATGESESVALTMKTQVKLDLLHENHFLKRLGVDSLEIQHGSEPIVSVSKLQLSPVRLLDAWNSWATGSLHPLTQSPYQGVGVFKGMSWCCDEVSLSNRDPAQADILIRDLKIVATEKNDEIQLHITGRILQTVGVFEAEFGFRGTVTGQGSKARTTLDFERAPARLVCSAFTHLLPDAFFHGKLELNGARENLVTHRLSGEFTEVDCSSLITPESLKQISPASAQESERASPMITGTCRIPCRNALFQNGNLVEFEGELISTGDGIVTRQLTECFPGLRWLDFQTSQPYQSFRMGIQLANGKGALYSPYDGGQLIWAHLPQNGNLLEICNSADQRFFFELR